MQKFNNILLFGGETKNENMPVGFYSSLAMLPLRGKPIIWWQLENLKNRGIDDFIIVVCSNNKKLIDYIKNILMANHKIELVLVSGKKNILSSLKYALKKADVKLPTRVILGDTMIIKSINNEKDVIFTSKDITTSENWCVIDKEMNLFDKEKDIDLTDKEALVGYYAFSDTQYLLNCCVKARLMFKKEISTALEMYMEKYQLNTKVIADWYDLGHTSGLIKAKNILFSARFFNSISINPELGLLTKTSTKIRKLEDEAFWYEHLPQDLKIIAPRLIEFKKDDSLGYLTLELYGYPTLQELYLSGEVNIEDWRFIIEKLFSFHKNLENHISPQIHTNALKWLYFDKTQERCNELKKQNSYWQECFNKDYEYINGQKYHGIAALKHGIEQKVLQISCIKGTENVETVIHGDFCFSNILFDSSNYIFKLIDPRGRLNAEPTIYGDPRYDIAKLRHSVVGLYDFIVQKLFKIKETSNGFSYKIYTTGNYSILESVFDKLTKANGFKIDEIKFIEGLLFLSMLPLHKDDFERQKMLYIRAIELLNATVKTTNKERLDGRKKTQNMY